VPGVDGEAWPLPGPPGPPGRNSLAPTENLNADVFGLSAREASFGEDQGDPAGDRDEDALLMLDDRFGLFEGVRLLGVRAPEVP